MNGKLVSLKHQLQNGDTVEIITSKNQTPNKDWLKHRDDSGQVEDPTARQSGSKSPGA